MNTGGICKRVDINHSLVRPHHKSGDLANHEAGCQKFLGVNANVDPKKITVCFDYRDNFFQRVIVCIFAKTIDCAFKLPRAAHHQTS